jgi:hypothetical protein
MANHPFATHLMVLMLTVKSPEQIMLSDLGNIGRYWAMLVLSVFQCGLYHPRLCDILVSGPQMRIKQKLLASSVHERQPWWPRPSSLFNTSAVCAEERNRN